MNENIIIDFSHFPFCFRTYKDKSFTNKLENSEEFFENFRTIIEKEIPFFSKHTFEDVVSASKKHSHAITTNNKKEYDLVIKIVKEIYKEYKNTDNNDAEIFIDNNINDYMIWQLGVSQGVRLIGTRDRNIFRVLFIDYHHMIFPSKKYNQRNYETFNFCPITSYNKEAINEYFIS